MATFTPIASHDSANKLHNQLMKAADSSTSFFPSGRTEPSTSQANLLRSDTRARKLSNKLTKRRPPLKTGSTPPSFRGQGPADKNGAFIEAVISNVDMVVSKGYEKREDSYQRALTERSPAVALNPLTGPYSAPTSSHKSQSSGESSFADRPTPSLKRASSLRDFGSRRELADPFGRGPPVIIGRAPPGLGNVVDVFGSAVIRHAGEPPPKTWTSPKDPMDSIIALYQLPAEDSFASKRTISRDNPRHPAAEKDDTIIALYKPPSLQTEAQNFNEPEPGSDPQIQSYTVAAAPVLAPTAAGSVQTKLQSLPRARSKRSQNAMGDVSRDSLTTPPLRTRPSEMPRPGVHWQPTPLKRSGTYSPNSPTSRPLRSALKRPAAPPPLNISRPSAPSASEPSEPASRMLHPAHQPPQSQPAKPGSNHNLTRSASSCESEADPPTPVDYEDTPFGPVPIYEPPEEYITPRRRNRSKAVVGPPRFSMAGLESPLLERPSHFTPSDPSELRENTQVETNDMNSIGHAFLAPYSEGPTPLSASFGGFGGGKASHIRNRILIERGGRA